MNCSEFEAVLDGVLHGEALPDWLETHASECPACSDLLTLARLPSDESVGLGGLAGLAGEVVSRTVGGACRQAEVGLNDFVSGLLPNGDRELLAEHVSHCEPCRDLVRELELLAVDLPQLSIIGPETSLVDDVLRRTLPPPVQLRRWWTGTWARWIRRPRFAIELAYGATLVLILIFGTPVSPLQAMPKQAFEIVRGKPLGRLEGLADGAKGELSSELQARFDRGSRRVHDIAAATRAGLGTISKEVASWFETDEDKPSDDDSRQETP